MPTQSGKPQSQNEAPWLPIGPFAARAGVSVSAVRFYEQRGLLRPDRNAGGQRRFHRADLRRLSFILIAQRLGFTLTEIADQLSALPDARAPTKADWAKISAGFGTVLDARIAEMTRLRERLDGCIGCGCLSLANCALHNPNDAIAAKGPGARFVLSEDG